MIPSVEVTPVAYWRKLPERLAFSFSLMKNNRMNDFKVGEDYIGVNCVFFCHDGHGKIVFHKRNGNCRDEANTWDCGGGTLEFGESFEDALRREVREEYGAEVLDIKYLGTRNVLRTNKSGKTTHWVANGFAVLVDHEEVIVGEPDKMDGLGWFSLDELPAPLHSQIAEHIEKFLPGNVIEGSR